MAPSSISALENSTIAPNRGVVFSESYYRAMIKSRLYNTFGLLLIGFIECMHMYETFNKIKFDIQRLDYRWRRPAFQLLKTVQIGKSNYCCYIVKTKVILGFLGVFINEKPLFSTYETKKKKI